MAPKRTTRSTTVPETTNTASVTNAQLQAMIDQGVTAAFTARDANRNGNDNHTSGMGVNTHVKTVGHDAAYGMPWKTLMKMMTDKYCPRNKIKKLEMEIWDLKVKRTDLTSYTQCFQELALLCGRMFPEESDKIKKYVGGLPDMIHMSVVEQRVKGSLRTPQGTLRTNNSNNRTRGRTLVGPTLQDLVRRSHTGDLNPYALNAIITTMVHVLLNAINATKLATLPVTVEGHFKRECPKLKNNNNRGNQFGGSNAPAKVYVVGHAGINPDSNVVMGTFLLNNHYASVLFDTGADRSFVSTAFIS
ncbi:reverse transcriptase domain-containing protein [Tanacetum coccineum]|uniref:Reverse transcriptase domain-containing protein n=1 Tax=Tanacetum coccineum TaxID=301880 RepID=A0ABQ4XHC7_9ASTR